jgi:hypothetical protein
VTLGGSAPQPPRLSVWSVARATAQGRRAGAGFGRLSAPHWPPNGGSTIRPAPAGSSQQDRAAGRLFLDLQATPEWPNRSLGSGQLRIRRQTLRPARLPVPAWPARDPRRDWKDTLDERSSIPLSPNVARVGALSLKWRAPAGAWGWASAAAGRAPPSETICTAVDCTHRPTRMVFESVSARVSTAGGPPRLPAERGPATRVNGRRRAETTKPAAGAPNPAPVRRPWAVAPQAPSHGHMGGLGGRAPQSHPTFDWGSP